tara:strand:- start:2328 stop:2606 length:279 start_codon:yes stop_codon:yes gene_type:complete
MENDNKEAVKITEIGADSFSQLTEIRRVFNDVAQFEALFGKERYDMIQEAFIKIMVPFETEVIEGIYDAIDIEVGQPEIDRRSCTRNAGSVC